MDHPLDGVVLKLNRAKAHLVELKQSVEQFRDEENYEMVRHEKRQGRLVRIFSWDVTLTKPFPPDWAILTGEVLYQTHSALDHLAWQLAALKSAPEEPENVTFPIFSGFGRFWRRNERGLYRQGSGVWLIRRMPADARRLVLDVQPYKCGDRAPQHPLWRLHVLSNEDKHKTLHVAFAALTKHELKVHKLQNVKRGPLKVTNRKPFDDRAEHVGEMRVIKTAPQAYLHVEPRFLFEEVFGERAPSPTVGLPIWETLKGVVNYVIDDVFNQRFIPYFEGR